MKDFVRTIYFLITASVLLTNCNMTKEFDVNIPISQVLGVYCNFYPDSVWKAQVFKLGNITDSIYGNSLLYVDDAEVKLFCNNEFQENLINVGSGIYISTNNSKPIENKKYYLEIFKEDYPSIVSTTETLPPLIKIDSIILYDSLQAEFSFFYVNSKKEEGDMQLDVFFENKEDLAILTTYPSFLLTNGYTGWDCYKYMYSLLKNEMNFLINNNETSNEFQISFTSNNFFEFYETVSIQENSQSGIISYFAGNIKSNISSGLGLFAGINYVYIDIDTIPIR